MLIFNSNDLVHHLLQRAGPQGGVFHASNIVADYVRLTDAMALHGTDPRLARKRLKDVQHG